MELDFNADVRIDESALDIEWLEQASLSIRYGEYWAKCKKRVAKCEERLKLVRSELVDAANRNPDKLLGEGNKPTAVNVEAYFRTHERHIEAKKELLQAQYELDLAEIAKNEISFTRKTALENLVKLHGQNYFAGPKLPRNLRFERDKDAERHRANSRVRMRK